MLKQPRTTSLHIALMALLLNGCERHQPVASPACVELAKTTDPIRKAELQKRCPRGGEFKPSSGIKW